MTTHSCVVVVLLLFVQLAGAVKSIPKCTLDTPGKIPTFGQLFATMRRDDPEKPDILDIDIDYRKHYSDKLFRSVNNDMMRSGSFLRLYEFLRAYADNNIHPTEGYVAKFEEFLDFAVKSRPFALLIEYFKLCQHPWFTTPLPEGVTRGEELKPILRQLWWDKLYFDNVNYRPFVHVFFGQKQTEVEQSSAGTRNNEYRASGLHSWVGLFYRERSRKHKAKYLHPWDKHYDVVANVRVELMSSIEGRVYGKGTSGMFMNTSPAFDFSIFTAAVLYRGSEGVERGQTLRTLTTSMYDCPFHLDHRLYFDNNGDIRISTIYPVPYVPPQERLHELDDCINSFNLRNVDCPRAEQPGDPLPLSEP
ncbi:hypothetical protein M3Y96_00439300 [Aphelenchoides besseyi]|nr:hypothetical protein M3Y96_00439300 [Aphelenchoides besseyi]